MTGVAITHTWADGSSARVEVEVRGDYPDSLAEAVARVLDLYRDVIAEGEE